MDRDGDISVSIASVWEIAIKFSLQRRTADMLPMSGTEAHACFLDAGFGIVAIEPSHVATLEHQPWIHRDPFDRLLVATGLASDRHLLTHDAALLAYSDCIISAEIPPAMLHTPHRPLLRRLDLDVTGIHVFGLEDRPFELVG